MQELIDLFYLYDYMAGHVDTYEEYLEFLKLRRYVLRLIKEMGS